MTGAEHEEAVRDARKRVENLEGELREIEEAERENPGQYGAEVEEVRQELDKAIKELERMERADPCRCNCGYKCGGPGTCEEKSLQKCLSEHFAQDCDHKWDGPTVSGPGVNGGWWDSATCSVCGTVQMFRFRCSTT